MCFYIVLDSLAASCIGWPTSRFVFKLGIRSQRLEIRDYDYLPGGSNFFPLYSSLFTFHSSLFYSSLSTLQRYDIFRLAPNFRPRFGAVFSTNWRHFQRPVISRPRGRNFRARDITFRRQRAISGICDMWICDIKHLPYQRRRIILYYIINYIIL